MTQVIYTPGVCNIGPEEIARRKAVGYAGLAITIVFIAALFIFNLPYMLRIAVFLPAFVSASGFVQAYMHFCVAFAQEGVFNVGSTGSVTSIADEKAKATDRKRTLQLYLYMVAIAILVTALTLAF